MQVHVVERLDADQRSQVIAVSNSAKATDGVAPLSEAVLLAVQGGLPAGASTDASTTSHFLAAAGTHLAGYAHLERGLAGAAATAEVVVNPAARRQGVGTALVRALERALEADARPLQLWSHGQLEGARAFALRDDYSIVRELWQMRRSLLTRRGSPPAGSLPVVTLPEGFGARSFVRGQDENAWLQVNARAFVDHPEQGRMTRHDLDQRIAEPWFEARGLILIEDLRGSAPVLAASHWTKVVLVDDPLVSPTQGEVYVVGVDPAYQGLGLGRAVTLLGLRYLRAQGMTQAMLYVDADNTAAVATYSRLSFTRFAVDVMYSPTVHPRVSR